eukprot:5849860-Prymnesium_polylepis.1
MRPPRSSRRCCGQTALQSRAEASLRYETRPAGSRATALDGAGRTHSKHRAVRTRRTSAGVAVRLSMMGRAAKRAEYAHARDP